MRRFLACLAFALAAAPAASAAAPVFIVDGHGWGHGIGMAQYGAQGFASRDGRSYDWILNHYYPGTTLGPSPVSAVRVLLSENRSSVSIGSDAAYSVTDAQGRTFNLKAGKVTLGPLLRITVNGQQKTLASPARFVRGTANLELGGRQYRGQLVVHSAGGSLDVVNHVGLEEYLYGVVPDEMPPSWHLEALKAQAVAARSYAVVSRRTSGNFDLYPDTRSQVYGGVRSEEARTNTAIGATAGQVVLHDGRVAYTFFHSTSGGRTAAIHHVWSTSPQPYLVSVPDPHDTLSPYHSWGPLRFSAAQLASKLGSSAPRGSLVDAAVARNGSLRVDSVRLEGAKSTSQISGTSFQSRLGLRSSWFAITVLGVAGSGRVGFGKAATLTGVARGPSTASLERRTGTGSWETMGPLTRSNGEFKLKTKPRATTWYRVTTPRGTSPEHRVSVAASVRLRRSGLALAGSVRPARAATPVALQRFVRNGWITIARATTNGRGQFRKRVTIRPGSYRAVAAPGRGVVSGVSPILKVGT